MIDTIFIPFFLFILIISLVVVMDLNERLGEALGTTIPMVGALSQKISSVTVFIIYGAYFGIPLAGVISAYMIGSRPIFAIFGIIMLMVGVFLFGIFKGVMVEIIPAFAYAFPYFEGNAVLSGMIEYYPFIMFIFGIIIITTQILRGQELG